MLCWKWLYHPLPCFVAPAVEVATRRRGRPTCRQPGRSAALPRCFAGECVRLKQALFFFSFLKT